MGLIVRGLAVWNFYVFRQVHNSGGKDFVFFPENFNHFLLFYNFLLKFVYEVVHKGQLCFQSDKSVFYFCGHSSFPFSLGGLLSAACRLPVVGFCVVAVVSPYQETVQVFGSARVKTSPRVIFWETVFFASGL